MLALVRMLHYFRSELLIVVNKAVLFDFFLIEKGGAEKGISIQQRSNPYYSRNGRKNKPNVFILI